MNSSKPSVCIICPSLYPLLDPSVDLKLAGGAEAQLKTLAMIFKKNGHPVDIVVDDFGQLPCQTINDINVKKVSFKYLGGSNLYLLPCWMELIRILFDIRADIYMLKLPRHLVFPVGLFCRILGKKFVFIGQIDTDVDMNFIRKAENLLSYFLYRTGMFFVHHSVAQNKVQEQGFKKRLGKNSTIIKNILTLPGAKNISKQDYILWVGNSSTKKQPERFVEIAEKLPQYNFKMIMSVSQERPDDSFIKDRIRRLKNFEYVGFVPFRKILPYYQQASLFISTSLREGFPNTFLQSWQFRTPVISLDIDPDGVICKYGLGAVSKDIDELCETICKFMEDEVLNQDAGEKAAAYVNNFHSESIVYSQYQKLFTQLFA